MKAWVLHGVDGLRWEELGKPALRPDEVLVEVKAAGICGSDIPRIYRTGAHTHPLIPGHEFSGRVVELGRDVDDGWREGRVGIFPLIPCGTCEPCRNRQFELCRNYGYLGSRRDGGFADYAAVPAWNLIRLPDAVTYEEAAMLEPMAVAVHAMRRVSLRPADRVAVCGLGTIGLLLLAFLREAGIDNILAIGNKELQERTVRALGVEKACYCDCRRQDAPTWLMEHTEGRGVDVFFECVGKQETFGWAVESMAPTGNVVTVGNPSSDMGLGRDTYWKILRNQLTIIGTWNSSFFHDTSDDWTYVLERVADGRVTPSKLITHRFSLEGLEKGLHLMWDKTQDYIKVMAV